jgi:hypothetical protein
MTGQNKIRIPYECTKKKKKKKKKRDVVSVTPTKRQFQTIENKIKAIHE